MQITKAMLNLFKKLIGILSLAIAVLCTLGLMAPTVKMTLEEVIKGKSVFLVLGFISASLAYYLLKYKK